MLYVCKALLFIICAGVIIHNTKNNMQDWYVYNYDFTHVPEFVTILMSKN